MTMTARAVSTNGSASRWVAEQVAGAPRQANVLHAGHSAVYLDVAGSCVAVLAHDAVPVPCGVRTSLHALPPVRAGDEAWVGNGWVTVPGCRVAVATDVDTTVPRMAPAAAVWGASTLAEWSHGRLDGVRDALPAEALDRLVAGDPGAVPALLGYGVGLTPLADDVLCGWLAAAVAAGHVALDGVRSEVGLQAVRRTTTLSATLLACAARGEAVPQYAALVAAVARGDRDGVWRSADDVLRIGDTSGAGLLLGALLALQAVR